MSRCALGRVEHKISGKVVYVVAPTPQHMIAVAGRYLGALSGDSMHVHILAGDTGLPSLIVHHDAVTGEDLTAMWAEEGKNILLANN